MNKANEKKRICKNYWDLLICMKVVSVIINY